MDLLAPQDMAIASAVPNDIPFLTTSYGASLITNFKLRHCHWSCCKANVAARLVALLKHLTQQQGQWQRPEGRIFAHSSSLLKLL